MTATIDQTTQPTPPAARRTADVLPSGGSGSPLRRVLRAARPVRWRLLLAAFLGALAIGCSVGLLATSAFLISMASTHPPILFLEVSIVMVRAFGIGRGVFRYAERLVGHDAAFRSLTDLRISLYDRLAVTAPANALAYRSGDLLSRLVADVDEMLDLHLRVVLPFAVALLVSIGSVLLIALFVGSAAIALGLALLVAGVVVPAITMRLVAASEARMAPVRGELAAETVTLTDHVAELVALGQADTVLQRISDSDTELTSIAGRSARTSGLGAALNMLALGAAVIAAIVFGTMAVSSGALQGVSLATVVLVPLATFEAVLVLPVAVITLIRVRQSAARICEVVDAPDLVPDPARPETLAAPLPPVPLAARDLFAGWTPGVWLAGPLSFDVGPGESLALIGPSGVGKSTVASALARLAPSAGNVAFGSQDLGRLTGDDVRRIIGLSPQDAHLFDSTIVENVRLANRSATDGDIRRILEELGLGPWLDSLPKGLETPVGRFGRGVSGGQRQRIALARILVSDHPVVVADEPTEHLDDDSAALVLAALHRYCADRALILITHRDRDAETCTGVLALDASKRD